MARYGAGGTKAGTNTADTPLVNLLITTAVHRLEIVEIKVGISVAPTTAPVFYLARGTTRGTSTGTATSNLPLDPADFTPDAIIDTAWSANPAFTAGSKLDVGPLAVTAGGAFIWTFYDRPLVVPSVANAGLLIVNANASGASTGTFAWSYRWDE